MTTPLDTQLYPLTQYQDKLRGNQPIPPTKKIRQKSAVSPTEKIDENFGEKNPRKLKNKNPRKFEN